MVSIRRLIAWYAPFRSNSGGTGAWLSWLIWLYLFVTISLVGIMHLAGDRWWLATVLLFGPRWLLSLPLVVLVPLTACYGRRLLLLLMITTLLIFGPFMGYNLPLFKIVAPLKQRVPALRVITCNIQSGNFNPEHLFSLINESAPDVVALQECPKKFKLSLPSGWQLERAGELAVLSRYPLRQVKSMTALHPPHTWPRTVLLHCVISAPGGDIDFCTVHLPSPRYGLQSVLSRKTILNPARAGLLKQETEHRRKTSQDVRSVISALNQPVIIAGDFNMPVESNIYSQVWGAYSNAFSSQGVGYGWTEGASQRGIVMSVRIDHILTGSGLTPSRCQVGPDVGSDHLPLIADIGRTKL
ncbi:MAG: hypothetical protein CXR30_15360 [Geobacter sp.]|nr:MAG: hypothetical protein CXR30_15360 [Geobacter sp.]